MINVKKHLINTKLLKSLPLQAGVYLFWDKDGQVHYVGKAKILKNRVSSYFTGQLLPKTQMMVENSTHLSFIPTNSEIEALLLESLLVKKYQPKYNIELKDDKSELYVVITKEAFPRVLTIRKTEIKVVSHSALFGPFPKSTEVKSVLARLRKAFPYATHKPTSRACLESQIGLCAPCPSVIRNTSDISERKLLLRQYRQNLTHINKILSGKVNLVRRELEKEMRRYSKSENYHEANLIKKQIAQIDFITQPQKDVWEYYQNPNFLSERREKETETLGELLQPYLRVGKLKRIECFDVAHLAGTAPTASMVTFQNGEPDKTYYRHFKIQTKLKGDTDRLSEVVQRRIKHLADWGVPDLMIMDGGKPQVSAALQTINKAGLNIPVIGLAKRMETIVIKSPKGFIQIRPKKDALFLLQRLRDEAHRFAQRYHHKLISDIFKR